MNGSFNLDVALTALETTATAAAFDAAGVDAEQRRSRNHAGHTDSDSDGREQHRDREFKDAALTLKVTPQITAANTVIMKISLENARRISRRPVNGIPPINTQRANTTVLVNDGQTTVIGGIYLSTEQYQTDRTPGLGTIPLLKLAVQARHRARQQTPSS